MYYPSNKTSSQCVSYNCFYTYHHFTINFPIVRGDCISAAFAGDICHKIKRRLLNLAKYFWSVVYSNGYVLAKILYHALLILFPFLPHFSHILLGPVFIYRF